VRQHAIALGQRISDLAACTHDTQARDDLSPNTVHFAIRMAAATSMRVVGCGVRGRNG